MIINRDTSWNTNSATQPSGLMHWTSLISRAGQRRWQDRDRETLVEFLFVFGCEIRNLFWLGLLLRFYSAVIAISSIWDTMITEDALAIFWTLQKNSTDRQLGTLEHC